MARDGVLATHFLRLPGGLGRTFVRQFGRQVGRAEAGERLFLAEERRRWSTVRERFWQVGRWGRLATELFRRVNCGRGRKEDQERES